MRQEILLAMLAKEPAPGHELRARMSEALGPLAEGMNDGQIYVPLGRLEKAGLIPRRHPGRAGESATYELTSAGQERLVVWLSDLSWPQPGLVEFHLKLASAARTGLADPVSIIDAQRRELLRRLRDAQRTAMGEPSESDAQLLLEGVVLRLQADIRWLEACERRWVTLRAKP